MEYRQGFHNRLLTSAVEAGILQQSSLCLNLHPGLGWAVEITFDWRLDVTPAGLQSSQSGPRVHENWEERQPSASVTLQLFHLPKDIQIYIFLFFTGGQDLPK